MSRLRRRVFALIAAALASGTGAAQSALQPRTLDATASYPEGPLWDGDRVLVAEMGADRISAYQAGAKTVFFTARGCGPTSIAPYGGGFVVLCHLDRSLVMVDRTGRPLRRWSRGVDGAPFQAPNDPAADGAGGVYFSDPGLFDQAAPASGRIYYLSASGEVRLVSGGLRYPNGVWVDRAGQALLVSEHLARKVWRFPIAADGSLGERTLVVDIDALPPPQLSGPRYREAGPDGLEIAPNGELFIAIYGEGRVVRVTSAGGWLGAVRAPARYVTNIAFNRRGDAVITAPALHDRPPFTGSVELRQGLAPLRQR